jgi:hypothetical protein
MEEAITTKTRKGSVGFRKMTGLASKTLSIAGSASIAITARDRLEKQHYRVKRAKQE